MPSFAIHAGPPDAVILDSWITGHSPSGPPTKSTVSPKFAELAAQQGVSPIDDFDSLFGEPSPEDEPVEEFSASLGE